MVFCGTDNGPLCGADGCPSTIYSYNSYTAAGDSGRYLSIVIARCAGCHRFTCFPIPSARLVNATAADVRSWHTHSVAGQVVR